MCEKHARYVRSSFYTDNVARLFLLAWILLVAYGFLFARS